MSFARSLRAIAEIPAGSDSALLGRDERAKTVFGEQCLTRGCLLLVPPLHFFSGSQQPVQAAVERCCRVDVIVFASLGMRG